MPITALPNFQDRALRFIKSSFKILNILGKRPDLLLKATITYLKHHSLATNPLLKTAVKSLYKACGIHTHRFQEQMNAWNSFCSKMLTWRTEFWGCHFGGIVAEMGFSSFPLFSFQTMEATVHPSVFNSSKDEYHWMSYQFSLY